MVFDWALGGLPQGTGLSRQSKRMERKLQEFAQGFQVPRIIAVRHNPPLWGPGGWELNVDPGQFLPLHSDTWVLPPAHGGSEHFMSLLLCSEGPETPG
jgi:hypothetical protein